MEVWKSTEVLNDPIDNIHCYSLMHQMACIRLDQLGYYEIIQHEASMQVNDFIEKMMVGERSD